MFNPGVMTEEAGTDIRSSLRTIDDLGLKQLEVSSFGAKKVSDLSVREVDELRAGLDDRGVAVSCVSPTIFFNLPLHAAPDERSYWGSYRERGRSACGGDVLLQQHQQLHDRPQAH